MHVFVDEAGDTGLQFTRGSSRYFALALVVFEDEEEMLRCNARINALRHELRKPLNFEFHFHNNSMRVKESFVRAVAGYKFTFHAIVFDKTAVFDPTTEQLTKKSFYKESSKFIFARTRPFLRDAFVIIDKNGTHEFHNALSRQVKAVMNTAGQKTIRRFRAERSSQNNLLQLADYVVSLVYRMEMGKEDEAGLFRLMSKKRKQFLRWPENPHQ